MLNVCSVRTCTELPGDIILEESKDEHDVIIEETMNRNQRFDDEVLTYPIILRLIQTPNSSKISNTSNGAKTDSDNSNHSKADPDGWDIPLNVWGTIYDPMNCENLTLKQKKKISGKNPS